MARRGFLAELQHQAKVSAREADKRQREAARQHQAALREAERARKAEERSRLAAARASDAERKRLEREAKAAHAEAMQAEVALKNALLQETYDEIDGLLEATLEVDDFVNLEALRREAEHPPFDRPDLETSLPPPAPIPDPPEPTMQDPGKAKGVFGRKRKQAEAQAALEVQYAKDREQWEREVASLPQRRAEAVQRHQAMQADRLQSLAKEQRRYEEECADREREVTGHNEQIDRLVANLGYGDESAVQEYVSIVLSNSVYPDFFEVDYEADFDASVAELQMRTMVPAPDSIPEVKAYKYVKARDEITSTALSQKASKDRYAGVVNQVVLRTLHEVFEADRRGIVRSISLEVGTETINPATGNQTYIPFVAVAADRETFMSFDLSAVDPSSTLDHLGAAVSRNPRGLVPAVTDGVRRS